MADARSNSPLIAFYRGIAPDVVGRRLDEIWGWDDARLERQHDYIQWLFPLPEKSRFNPDAPCLTAAEANAFRSDANLQAHLGRSLARMLRFYGFVPENRAIVRATNFPARAATWLTPLNHNYLRLTRILLSLGYLGRSDDAGSLLACLLDIQPSEGSAAISARTRQFWVDAVHNPPPF